MNKIVIYGAGGFGREVAQIIRDINNVAAEWHCVGFITDNPDRESHTIADLPLLGGLEWLAEHPDVQVVIAIGASSTRYKVACSIEERCKNRFATLVHPRAWIGAGVSIGAGSIVCAGALITTDIAIGKHVHINIGSTIGHDAQLRDYVTLNPSVNVSGNVLLEAGAQIGTGSVIIPGCIVGEWSVIGAGAVVTKSLIANCTAVGAPAQVIKERPSGWHK